MNFALLLLLFVRPLSAQLQSVDMRVSGLDCASCAGSVEKAVARIRGVETVSFTGERVIIRLKQDNAVTLGRIRDALKGIGYTPNEARVTVRGTARNDRGRWLLATPSGLTFEISRGSREGDALATGVVRPPAGPGARERIEGWSEVRRSIARAGCGRSWSASRATGTSRRRELGSLYEARHEHTRAVEAFEACLQRAARGPDEAVVGASIARKSADAGAQAADTAPVDTNYDGLPKRPARKCSF